LRKHSSFSVANSPSRNQRGRRPDYRMAVKRGTDNPGRTVLQKQDEGWITPLH